MEDEGYGGREDDFIDVFQELFEFSLMQCANVYWVKRKTKGDSWQDMTPGLLRALLNREIEEYESMPANSPAEYQELIDIVNVALMLIERLSKQKL